MNNYALIDFSNEINSNLKNNYKDKFITNTELKNNSIPQNISHIVEEESKLKKNLNINNINNINNNNNDEYDLTYSNKTKKEYIQKTGFYYNNKDIGAGRGFGNLNISNDIRYGDASRLNTKELKEISESNILDYQFQYLDRNFQDPNHLIMPIPRGGDMTRKQNQLCINTIKVPDNYSDERVQTIKFNY
jgi:hypothetical protein